MFRIEIARNLCKGCGICILFCKGEVISISSQINEQGYYPAEVSNENECLGCKNCYLMCPDVAIEVYRVD